MSAPLLAYGVALLGCAVTCCLAARGRILGAVACLAAFELFMLAMSCWTTA